MPEFAALRSRTYNYLNDNNNENWKGKDTKKCIIKQKLTFEVCKTCLEANQVGKEKNCLEKIILM